MFHQLIDIERSLVTSTSYEVTNLNFWDNTARIGICRQLSKKVRDRSSANFQYR